LVSKKNGPAAFLPAWLVRAASFLWGPGRTLTAAALLAALFSAGIWAVWRHVRERVVSSGQYTITPEKIEITPKPPWIHTDVRGEVFRYGSLEGLSSLDDRAGERIASAFALHPWIAKARVNLRAPARIQVELTYRRPMCMVEVPGDLLPVDVEGILLPSGDFSPIEKQSYPCVGGIDTRPRGPVGQRWGDGRVVDGAEIAAALGAAWQPLKLYRIVPAATVNAAAAEEPSYDLFTRAGTRVLWGRAPRTKIAGELPTAEKVARLAQYAADHGSLEGRSGPQQIDVRSLPPAREKL
jgi:hypothetical protein